MCACWVHVHVWASHRPVEVGAWQECVQRSELCTCSFGGTWSMLEIDCAFLCHSRRDTRQLFHANAGSPQRSCLAAAAGSTPAAVAGGCRCSAALQRTPALRLFVQARACFAAGFPCTLNVLCLQTGMRQGKLQLARKAAHDVRSQVDLLSHSRAGAVLGWRCTIGGDCTCLPQVHPMLCATTPARQPVMTVVLDIEVLAL
jgi:hypothetical protein